MRNFVHAPSLSCFQLIKLVLDDLYNQLSGQGNEKDDIIRDRLVELREEYSSGTMPDYIDLHECFAYLYCYVAAHANIVYRLIEKTSSSIFENDKVVVTSLGGGPGSDLLGILKFMIMKNKSPKFRCMIYDKQMVWLPPLKIMDSRVTNFFTIDASFNFVDVSKPETWAKDSQLWYADLFTLSYFMSEVYDQADQFFLELFGRAQKGSQFLFIDRYSGDSHYLFDNLVCQYNKQRDRGSMEMMSNSDCYTCTMEHNEEKTDLGVFYDKFREASLPKTLGKKSPFVYRIYRKN